MRASLPHEGEAEHEQPGFDFWRTEYGHISHLGSLGGLDRFGKRPDRLRRL